MIKKIIYFLILVIIFSSLNFSFSQQNQPEIKNLCNFTRNLKIGSKGDDVKCLQNYLKELKLLKSQANGYYGLSTKRAVLKWQQINNLLPTGIFELSSITKYYSLVIMKEENEKKMFTSKKNLSLITNTTSFFIASIDDRDIVVDVKNSKDIVDYLMNFNSKISTIEEYKNVLQKMFAFVWTGTTTVIDNDKSLFKIDEPLLPGLFVANNLKFDSKEKEKLIEKTLLLKKMIELRVGESKKLTVNPDLKNFHKSIIYADLLGLEILNKFLDYLDNKISENEIKLYLDEYERIIEEKRLEITNEVLRLTKSTSLLNKILYELLSLSFIFPKQTHAFLPFIPFGGKVMNVNLCFSTCPAGIPFGFLVVIGPPRPITLFVPFSFLASPLNYLYRQITTMGVWSLGLALPQMFPCNNCFWVSSFFGGFWRLQPIGQGFFIFMTGSSLIPSIF